jgi:hypothetical protein
MWMRTICLIVTLALGLLVAPLVAAEPPLAKIPRIGVLSPRAPDAHSVLKQGLRGLGYVDGQNTVFEGRG